MHIINGLGRGLLLACLLAFTGCTTLSDTPPVAYIVFFTYDSGVLSADAHKVVDEAAAAAKASNPASIEIAGFSGKEPAPRADDELAAQRFLAVEDALVADGIDRALFARKTLVDTVVLPATALRRVEIRLTGKKR